jgi:hypothetical protein
MGQGKPTPKVASRVALRLADIVTELFKSVFQSSDAARDLWAILHPNLNDMRFEIITGARNPPPSHKHFSATSWYGHSRKRLSHLSSWQAYCGVLMSGLAPPMSI